jgi:hypothetical protein
MIVIYNFYFMVLMFRLLFLILMMLEVMFNVFCKAMCVIYGCEGIVTRFILGFKCRLLGGYGYSE